MRAMPTRAKTEALSEAQMAALAALLDGATVTEAANVAGVSRQTCSAWKNRCPTFGAVLNAGRLDVWSHVQDRMRKLVGQSLDVLEVEVKGGNVRAARDVLRAAEKLNLDKIGPTCPQLVQNELDEREDALVMSQVARVLFATNTDSLDGA
jgi:hypothetical protein